MDRHLFHNRKDNAVTARSPLSRQHPLFDPISGSMYNSDHFSLPEEDLSSARDLSDYSQEKEEHIGPVEEDPTTYGPVRRMWEGFRDVCYIVQDSKSFQNLTIGIIIANAIILAIVW